MKLPSLNEYIRECRTNRFQAAKMKRDMEQAIAVYIWRLPRFEHPVHINFIWTEENRKRDYDNIAAGGRKFILDALVKCGKLKDDNRRFVTGFQDTFRYGEKANVELRITETFEEVERG
jgi:Holliday junction resolvase RusA-like endonuclease